MLQDPGRRCEGQSRIWGFARPAVGRGTLLTVGPLAEPEEASGRPRAESLIEPWFASSCDSQRLRIVQRGSGAPARRPMRKKKTGPRPQRHPKASGPHHTGLMAQEHDASRSAVRECPLDRHSHRTPDQVLTPTAVRNCGLRVRGAKLSPRGPCGPTPFAEMAAKPRCLVERAAGSVTVHGQSNPLGARASRRLLWFLNRRIFPYPCEVMGYSGIAPRAHSSGSQWHGALAKNGNAKLRRVSRCSPTCAQALGLAAAGDADPERPLLDATPA